MPFFPAGFWCQVAADFQSTLTPCQRPFTPSFDFPEVLRENDPFSCWLLPNFTCLRHTSWIYHYPTCSTALQTFIHSISTYWLMETKAGHSSSGDWAVWYEDYQLILDSSCLYSKDCTICHSITQNPEITVRQMKEVYSHPNEIGLWFIPIHTQTSYVYTKPKMILFGCVEWVHWSWLSLPLDLISFMDSRENSFLLSISYFYFFF